MGGKALKNTITKRMDLTNYLRIKQYVISKLETEGYIIETINETPGKDSFGDLDLLYWIEPELNKDIRHDVIKLFKPNEIVRNGNVCSWDFEQFQIDLIKCSNLNEMAFSKFYFSYGDVGGILGRICSAHGLKFGHDGFRVVLFDQTVYPENPFDYKKTHTEILLSDNPEKVCQFLGLNWNQYTSGFTNVNEIFEWIIKSKYFSLDLFNTFNAENIKRLKIRPMYIKFIEYIGINKDKIYRGHQFSYNEQPVAIKYFNVEHLVEQVKKDLEIKKAVQNKFNGYYLIGLGYDGKQTGKIISDFKAKVTKDFGISWDQWIFESDVELIYKVLGDVINSCNFSNNS